MPVTGVAIRLLGPVELWSGERAIAAGGPTQRAVLAMLALHAGEPVAVDALADGIWGESDEPLASGRAVRVHVSRIRATLQTAGASEALETVSGGYRLAPGQIEIDTRRFERGLAAGRAALVGNDPVAAKGSLEAALALFRGSALMDVRDFPFASVVASRYDELRVDALEELFEARLALGEHQALVTELQALVGEHPYRERIHAQLMLALYRAGRQSAALDAFQAARSRLVLDLGVEPGPELAHLQQMVLEQSPQLDVPMIAARTAELPPAPRPVVRRLPAVPNLIGRDELLAELAALSETERLITLTGAGGSGKTAIALGLLHRVAPRFPDGAAFVDLAAVTRGDQVLPAIGAAIGLSFGAGSDIELMAEVLAERRMIVLLDNFEHLLDVASDVAPLVTSGASKLLATSRAPLGLKDEYVVLVPPLPVPGSAAADPSGEPSVQLFLRAARAAGAGPLSDPEELAAISAICMQLDGLPLAIEIVASQTRAEDVRDLAAHLADRLPALRARPRDAPDRQRTMEGAIRWSVDRLVVEHRKAFLRLAVFAGSCDARGAAAVIETDRQGAIEVLAALLDASLIVRQPSIAGQARFRMLEPIRSVAKTLADRGELAHAVERHAEFVSGEIDRLCPVATGIRSPEDLAVLRGEHANLMAALAHLAQMRPDQCVDRMVQLDDYWIWAGGEAGAMHLIRELLEGEALSSRARCSALTLGLSFQTRLGFDTASEDALELALKLSSADADASVNSRVHLVEAWWAILAHGSQGEARARRAIRTAVASARRAGDRKLVVETLAFAGWLQSRAGHLKRDEVRVRQWLDEALGIARAESMAHAETLVLRALTNFHGTLRADAAEATAAAREALEIARRFDSPERAAWYAINVGVFAVLAGSLEEGRMAFLTSLRTDDRTGHRLAAMYHVINLALVESALGHWRNALMLYAGTESVARRLGSELLVALDPEDEAARQAAELHLGPDGTAKALTAGERMTYRDLVDFAFEVNGVTVS